MARPLRRLLPAVLAVLPIVSAAHELDAAGAYVFIDRGQLDVPDGFGASVEASLANGLLYVYAKPPGDPADPWYFTTIDVDTRQVTCPQGQTNTCWSPAVQRGTEVIVAGEKVKRSVLKAGMNCSFTVKGVETALKIACK